MSILNWAIVNPKLATFLSGAFAVTCISGIIALSDISEGSSSHFLFRHVPDHDNEGRPWVEVMDGKDFYEAPLVKHSYKRIIEGDTTYNRGNYVVYYGSEACPHCTGFLFNDQSLASGKLSVKNDRMSAGAWMKAFAFSKTDPLLSKENIKFLMYEDIPDKQVVNEKGDEYWTLPWSSWSYSDLEKGKKAGEHIRNDRSAVDFRKIIDKAKDTFKDKVPGTPTVIVYKKGVPVVFNHDVFEGLETKKQDESMTSDSILIRYIKYYYSQDKLKLKEVDK